MMFKLGEDAEGDVPVLPALSAGATPFETTVVSVAAVMIAWIVR